MNGRRIQRADLTNNCDSTGKTRFRMSGIRASAHMQQVSPALPSVGDQSPADRSSNEPLWWVLAMVAAAAIARMAVQWNLPWPACNFKRLTGAPCPLCGGTRAMRSVAELDILTALRFNPLVALGVVVIIFWFGLWLVDRVRAQPLLPRIRNRIQQWPVWWMLGGLVLANWAYLIQTLP